MRHGGFLLALVALGVANYLPTRHALAALLFGLAQWLLLKPYLPELVQSEPPVSEVGVILIVIALGAVWRPVRSTAGQDPLDRLWRDFCDAYGLLWGLRVAERFNAQAAKSGLPVRLGWRRFSAAAGQDLTALSAAERRAVTDQLTSWLRRFVDASGSPGGSTGHRSVRADPKTASENGTVPFCFADSAKLGQSPSVFGSALRAHVGCRQLAHGRQRRQAWQALRDRFWRFCGGRVGCSKRADLLAARRHDRYRQSKVAPVRHDLPNGAVGSGVARQKKLPPAQLASRRYCACRTAAGARRRAANPPGLASAAYRTSRPPGCRSTCSSSRTPEVHTSDG